MLLVVLVLSFVLEAISFSFNREYYTSDGIKSGLSVDQPYFLLNGKNITIYSGSIHYFRVPRIYWRDRILKLKAMGANTVETYIAWNMHEPTPGYYDFGWGGSDMEDFLHLGEFIEIAQQEDLFVIIRSGPFICAEFEFGGFPSWLLRDEGLEVRSSNEIYMKYVSRWFNVLMPILARYQFTNGGPIIALQVENEFAMYGGGKDKTYLTELRQLMLDNGIVELLVTSDNPWRGSGGTITDYFFMTGNFNTDGQKNLDLLKGLQPNKPVMVMEYWSGWFDYWGKSHQTGSLGNFKDIYETILSYPASVNIYMFIGGTNFGFLSGSQNLNYDDLNSKFSPMTTSYDYDALLAENGDYTDKYYAAKELLAKYNTNPSIPLPDMPALVSRVAYPSIAVTQEIGFNSFLSTLQNEDRTNLVSMEKLNVNNGVGQSYGYIIYSTNLDLPEHSILKIVGRVCDTVIVLVNGQRVSPILENKAGLSNFGTWAIENSTLTLNDVDLNNAKLDLLVENWGRVNVGVYKQYKGLWQGNIEINNQAIYNWRHSSLEFNKSWTNQLDLWNNVSLKTTTDLTDPKLFKAVLNISENPRDTYVHMENWTKGIVIVNGMVLGRYSKIGPQQALYLPAPLLKKGNNDIVIFEHFRADGQINFVTDPIYKVY